MNIPHIPDYLVNIIYLVSVLFFIFGLKRLSSPRSARQGNRLSMIGMAMAIIVTLLDHQILSYQMIAVGLAIGAAFGILMAKKVAMTGMPQMVAVLNGFGGIASALVALAEYHHGIDPAAAGDVNILHPLTYTTMILSVIIGTLTFTGSMIAFAKLQELITGKPVMVTLSKPVNVLLVGGVIALAIMLHGAENISTLEYMYGITAAAFILGITLVIPIGGADMPVVVSLLNSYSGIAVAMTGFVLKNNALIVVGSLVGASGIILTNIMCKAMNRSLLNVLFGGFGTGAADPAAAGAVQGTVKSSSPEEAGMILDVAEKVIIVPGYGMAVSQAQHVVKKLSDILDKRGISVSFAIHPVAGRMPGHMNVLLAESGVDYDKLYDMDAINDDFVNADVAIVIGANDVVNPGAKTNPASPIYGMPVLNVEHAKSVMVLKRSMNPGFAGIDNELFYQPNTMMVFGDAKKTIEGFIAALEELE